MPIIAPSNEILKFLEGTVGLVEANSYESMSLWQEHHNIRGRSWRSENSGYLVCVGTFSKLPIYVSMLFSYVEENKILFWYPTSRIVDYQIIEEWFKTYMPRSAFQSDSEYLNKTDAMNFYNVLNSANRKKETVNG